MEKEFAPKEKEFTLKEKIAFFKKKWLREHAWLVVLCVVAYFLLCAWIAYGKLVWLCPLLPVLALVGYGFLRNRMMIYVEKRAFPPENNG